jgi:hypothetical protein
MGHSQVQYHPVLGGKCQKCEGSGRLTAPSSLLSPLDWQTPAKDPATRKTLPPLRRDRPRGHRAPEVLRLLGVRRPLITVRSVSVGWKC